MGEDETGLYIVSKIYNDYFIQRFNKSTLKVEYNEPVYKLISAYSYTNLEGIFYVGGTFMVFKSVFVDKQDSYNIFVTQYDALTGEMLVDSKNLLSIDAPSFKKKGSFNLLVSEDKTKILLNYANFLKSNKSWKEINILYDHKLNVITEKESNIPENELNFRVFNFFIDNDGSFYHIKYTSTGQASVVSYNANMDYERWEAKVDLSDLDKHMSVFYSKFILNRENDLLLVGLYTRDKESLDGSFMIKIDTDSKEIVSTKANPLSVETKTNLASSSAVFSNKKVILPMTTYDIFKTYAKADGGFIITGENVYSVENRIITEDAIILNHSEDGELTWSNRIAKKQAGNFTKTKYMSFFASVEDTNFSVYTYEQKENFEKSTVSYYRVNKYPTTFGNIKSLVFTEYKFNLNTGVCSKSEFKAPGKETYIITGNCHQQKFNKDIFFFSKKGKKYQIGIKSPQKTIALQN